MDDSLSDFQEPKKSCTGPKNIKSKPKKVPKKIRGQKDIRTALKGKRELESYSKDFDKVCKKAGINVDSEELQLAIALSKSLQNEPSTSQSEGVTSKERIGKIRTTLQEYGFKVPEVKITTGTGKKKSRKSYKLISSSDIEKTELIANRYSEVLFKNIHNSVNVDNISDKLNNRLYYLATSADYSVLKTQDTFYIDNLIEKSLSTGNLLRNWSEIPGRAVSPKLFEPSNMNFSEIECSQEEIDVVLSGTLKCCKNVIDRKELLVISNDGCIVVIDNDDINTKDINNGDEIYNNEKTLVNVNEYQEVPSIKQRSLSPDLFDDDDASSTLNENNSTVQENTLEIHKNCSDVLDIPVPDSKVKIVAVYGNLDIDLVTNTGTSRRKSNDMEITNCIEIETKYDLPLSQRNDITKRRSNDFMEMTECVGASSQPLLDDKIDLTQTPEDNMVTKKIITSEKEAIHLVEFNKGTGTLPSKLIEDNIDLTDNTGDNENIIVLDKDHKNLDKAERREDIDLTQSSNSDDELPFVSLSGINNKDDFTSRKDNSTRNKDNSASKTDNSLNDTIVLDLKEYPELKNTNSQNMREVHIDLTQHDENTIEISKQSQSFFEDYLHDHSEERNSTADTSNEKHKSIESPNLTNTNESKHQAGKENIKENLLAIRTKKHVAEQVNLTLSPIHKPANDNDIDLTQNSDASSYSSQIDSILKDASEGQVSNIESHASTSKNSQSYSSLGKKDDVSIDYDEFCTTKLNENSKNAKLLIYEIADENEETSHSKIVDENQDISQNISNCSQNSVFQISDKEFDYSMHKYKLERPDHFAIGGISIMDDLSTLGSFKKSVENSNRNENMDTNKHREISPIKHRRITEIATPQKACTSNTVTVLTPKNSEFIIKTNDVTPMLDYESMSTPDIHRELDKYGIKPFKRKWAIQLLTHIYNQTHPIVEDCDEFASPPKRHKPNDALPRKRISPRKLLQPPKKVIEADVSTGNEYQTGNGQFQKENGGIDRIKDTQGTSKDIGLICGFATSTEVECRPEDWVFQKREKAKVHSCRVPLHIAFYNYMRSNNELRESILCYEPVNIDDIHKNLVGFGHRYDPKDLLKFLDKKCITVKTTDNDARNHNR